MTGLRERLSEIGLRRIAFTLLVLVPLVLYVVVFQMWRNQALLITSWVGGVGLLPEAFHHPAHRLHEFAAAMVLWPLLVGLLAQLRSPTRHVSGMLMALVSIAGVLVAIALTDGWEVAIVLVFLGVPTVLAAILHPAGRELLDTFSVSRLNTVILALVVVAAIPLLAFTATQVNLQTGAIEQTHDHEEGGHAEEIHEQHVEHNHFMFVAAFLVAVVGVGLVVSFQPPGWRLSAWVVGAMIAVFGLSGLLVPDASSNPGTLWNFAALVWAAGFVAAAEATRRSDRVAPPRAGGPESTP